MDDAAYEIARLKAEIARLEAEVARLRAGGCARDQGLTQYCAVAVDAYNRGRRQGLEDAALAKSGKT